MTTPSVKTVAQAIATGRYDDDFQPIFDAVKSRMESGEIGTTWRIDLVDLHVTENDLTLDEAFLIEQVAGVTWHQIDPALSAKHCRAVIQVCLTEREGLSTEEAAAKVKKLRVADITRAITREVHSPAPLDVEPSPTGSEISA